MEHIITSSKYKDNVHEYNGVYFYLNPSWKRILIGLSGGADSAIMTYILCSIITKHDFDMEIHVMSGIRNWKTKPWADYYSVEVFKYLENSFRNLKFVRHSFFVPPDFEYSNIGPVIKDINGNMKSGDQIVNRSFGEYICSKYQIGGRFNGLTKNIESTKAPGMPTRNQSFTNSIEDLQLLIFEHDNVCVANPMRFETKDWVMRAYQELDQIELLNKTRSCEGIFDDLDYTNYIYGQEVPECGTCYWCNERHISMKNNGI